MQHNECHFICDQFTDYQDHTLTAEIKARIETHLASCSACNTLYTELSATLHQLHQIPTLQTSPNFTAELMNRVTSAGEVGVWRKMTASGYARWAGYAVAAGLVLALGLNMWFDPVPLNSPQGGRSFTTNPRTPEVQSAAFADQADSLQLPQTDSLQLSPGTINSSAQPLQLVNGTK